MPQNKIRQGNAYVASASFTKAHGAYPSPCEMQTDTRASFRKGSKFQIAIGSSQWRGYAVDVRDHIGEGSGRTTAVRGIDYRDDLFCVTVFGKINMIDPNTGEVYSIIEKQPEIQASVKKDGGSFGTLITADGLEVGVGGEGRIPAKFRQAGTDTWVKQGIELTKIYPREILQWLCALCDFQPIYTPGASARLKAAGNADWRNSRYNIYNIDWNTGIKCGPAIDQICSLLGMQVTILHGSGRTLRFSLIGEQSFSFAWAGNIANESEVGSAIQPDVDTGVWIVGERELIEWTDLPLIPAWNQKWNLYALNPAALTAALEIAEMNEVTAKVNDMAVALKGTDDGLAETGFIDGKKFGEMTVSEYLRNVVFRVYWIKGMDKILAADEYAGTRPVRDKKLATPLITNPAKAFIVKAHALNEDHTNRLQFFEDPSRAGLIELDSGYSVREDTGQVVFDRPKFWFTPDALKKKMDDEFTADDYIPDEPTITAVFYGEVYRKFFGTSERAGSKHVPGLRHAYVVTNYKEGLPKDPKDFYWVGEKTADQYASDVAANILQRKRIVKSGSETFIGTAGHEPTGEIQRIVVTLDESSGVKEQVSYANDEPSPDYEPQIELRRKIVTDWAIKGFNKLEADKKNLKLADALKRAATTEKDAGSNTVKYFNDLRYGAATHEVKVRTPESENDKADVKAGAPAVASVAEGVRTTKKSGDIKRGDNNFEGVHAVSAETGHVAVINTGVSMARVKGRVKKGDALTTALGGDCFEAGRPQQAIAMQDTDPKEDDDVTRIPVRLGSGSSQGMLTVTCATWKNCTFPDEPESTEFDDVDLDVEFNLRESVSILVWLQDDPAENGIYQYDANADSGKRWRKVQPLNSEDLWDTEIFVRWGKRWQNLKFMYRKENRVVPRFDIPFPVAHASYESETTTGLGAMLTGYTPNEGDMIFVKAGGLFVAMEGAWTWIARVLYSGLTESYSTLPDNQGRMRSQEYERMVGASCSGGDVVGQFEFHDLCIYPTRLWEAP